MTTPRPPIELVEAQDTLFITGLAPHLSVGTYPPGIEVITRGVPGGDFVACLDGHENVFATGINDRAAARRLLSNLQLGRDMAAVLAAIANPSSDRDWQRGDLVLVDGTKEGCVLSVNGNVAQVSMWAAQAAVVNVERLSPLEVTGERVEHPEEREQVPGLSDFKRVIEAIENVRLLPGETDNCIDPTPAIRCKPEVGVVLASPDGPILTVDPLDGGNVWEVNIPDVVRWHEARNPEPSFLQRLAGHPEWHQRSHPDVRAAIAEGHAEIVATMDYYLVTLKLLPAGKAALEASK